MIDNQLQNALTEKLTMEQNQYREWLLSLPPEEILDHAYEYAIREDIVLATEDEPLSEKQCKALLKLDTPVADIFNDFKKRTTDHMFTIQDTMACCANRLLRKEFLQRASER